jgi:hypothetical protein
MDCKVQTLSDAKPVGGDITLLLQILAEDGTWLRDVATLTAEGGANVWTSVSVGAPSIAAAGKTFTVGFALSGSAAHQFIAPPNVSFPLLDVPLLSMRHRGVSATSGPTGVFASVQPSLHASQNNYSSILGDTYDLLELRFTVHVVDDLTVFHENDAFAARQMVDDEWRRQIEFAHDPELLTMSRFHDPADAQHLSAPNSTLLIGMLPGRNQFKLRWEFFGEVMLHVWNGADVAQPAVQIVLYNSPDHRNVMQGTPIWLGTQLLSLDPLTRLEDLSFEWSSPSHPHLQLIGGTHPGASASGHSNRATVASPPAGELWVNGSMLSIPGSYTFTVLVTDRHPGHRSAKDGGVVTASASVIVVVLARRDFIALGCEFTRDELTGLCLPCPQGAYCPGGQIISNKRAQ